MGFIAVRLKPKGAFHIGEREGWREGSKVFISSDTIFSGLCHCYGLLHGEVETLLKGFLENKPPFLISSAFPYWQGRYFFPVPKNQIPREKKAKKIQFVELEGLKRLLRGESLESMSAGFKTIPSNNGEFPWEMEDVPRVSLNRQSNHPGESFFHFGQVSYSDDAELFFLLLWKSQDLRERFVASLNLLSHEGIGGDRSSGKGLFSKPVYSEIELPDRPEADGMYSLSLYHPLKDEMYGFDRGYYELSVRKGYIYSPHGQSRRRRSVRMFSEGSVLPQGKRIGNLVDVTPDEFKFHRVYRYGFLLSVPCKLETS